MIDYEPEVFTALATKLRAEVSGITVDSVPTYAPASFPHASVEEIDNQMYRASQDSASNENHVVVTYEVVAYSNRQGAKKRECKKIISVCDEVMDEYGFTRLGLSPVYIDEGSKCRMVARYTAVISKNGIIYRR